MILIADASALVGELLRKRGRLLLNHPDVDWYVTVEVASEVRHELHKRCHFMVRRGHLSHERAVVLEREAFALFQRSVSLVVSDVYTQVREEAEARIRDPHDWSAVALALVMEAGIWADDQDFFGIGVPVWSTQVLLTHLHLNPIEGR
jgi:predicted nucleic acid-binding protein